MIRKRQKAWVLATILTAIASGAQAQTIFTGDCARANALLAAKPASSYFRDSYMGAAGFEAPDDACGRTKLWTYAATRRSASATVVVFDLTRRDLRAWNTVGTCADPYKWNSTVVGTLTIELKVQPRTGACDLLMMGAYRLTDPASPAWSGNFNQRIVPIGEDGTFFVSTGGREIVAFHAN